MRQRLEPADLARRIRRLSGAEQVTLEARLQQLWGGYGELWRVALTRPAGVVSAIVKQVQPPPGPQDRSHRRKLRSYAVERAFYERYAARCLEAPDCRVPRALGLTSEGGGWLFVLEDLDASGFAARSNHASEEQIAATLRWLATFHARFLNTPPEELWSTGTYWHLATRPDELAAMRHAALRRAASGIDRALEQARFKTLVHGDAKLENVCFSSDSRRAALVDFQYVGGGVGVKDLAYFLSSCVAPRACEKLVPGYVDAYFEELGRAVRELRPDVDAAALEREWRALFPLAWVDFYRFLLGWAAESLGDEPYSELLTEQVLASLSSA